MPATPSVVRRRLGLGDLLVAATLLVVVVGVVLFGGVEPRVVNPLIVGLAALGILALGSSLLGNDPLPGDPVLLAGGLMLAAGVVSLPTSINQFLTREWLLRLVAACVVYGIISHGLRSRRSARVAVVVLVAVAFAAAAYGIAITLSGRDTVLWAAKEEYRDSLTGTFINRNHFAVFLAMHLYAGLGLFAMSGRRRRRLLVAPLGLALLALGLTLSRGGVLAAAAAVPLFLSLLPSAHRSRLRPVALALVLAGVALLGTNWSRFQQRIEDSVAGGEPSAAARLSLWRSSLRAIADAPLVGHGAGTFVKLYPRYRERGIHRKVDYAHQEYLELAAELGLVGIVAAALALWLVVVAVSRALAGAGEDGPLVVGIASGLGALAVHALVDFPLKIPAIPLAAAALLGVATRLGRTDRATCSPPRSMAAQLTTRLASGSGVVVLALVGRLATIGYLADRHIRAADAAFGRPNWDAAAIDYQAAIAIDLGNPRGYEGLAQTEANRAKFRSRDGMDNRRQLAAQALAHFATAERLDSRSGDYNLQRAWLLNFLQQYPAAAAEYELAVADDPENTNVLYLAASFNLHHGDRERGLALLGRAIESWPNFFGEKLNELHHRVNDPDRLLAVIPEDQPFLVFQYAVHLLTRADQPEVSRRMFDTAVARAGWRDDWTIPYGGMLAAVVSRDAALELYATIPRAHKTAADWLEVAKLANANDDGEAAFAALVAGAGDHPTDRELVRMLAAFGGAKPEVAAALAAYRAGGGEEAGYWVAAAAGALTAGDPVTARAHLDRALAIDPADQPAKAARERLPKFTGEQGQ